MTNHIVALGTEKPVADRYMTQKSIDSLDGIKPANGCHGVEHHVVFADYRIGPDSSFFDVVPGICSCGFYYKKPASNGDGTFREYLINTGKIPPRN